MSPLHYAWAIDVCRHCGRLAVWPGCEHWQKHDGWTIPISVRPTPSSARTLDEAIRRAADERQR